MTVVSIPVRQAYLDKSDVASEEVDEIARGLGINDGEEKGIMKKDFMARAQIWLANDKDDKAAGASQSATQKLAGGISRLREEGKTMRGAVASTVVALSTSDNSSLSHQEQAAKETSLSRSVTDSTSVQRAGRGSAWQLASFVLAVEPQLVGTLSLVIGNELDMTANNLLATRSGSNVTVCPRGVLLRKGSGQWYFEIQILRTSASGSVCCGVVSESFHADGGATEVGQDAHSWGVSTRGAQHDGKIRSLGGHPWKDGDVIGCWVDCRGRGELRFTHNGQPIGVGAGAAHTGVVGIVGVCPALTIDCGCALPAIRLTPPPLTSVPIGSALLTRQFWASSIWGSTAFDTRLRATRPSTPTFRRSARCCTAGSRSSLDLCVLCHTAAPWK